MGLNNNEKLRILNAAYPAGTYKIMLLDNTYVQDIDTEHFWADIDQFEVSGTGYSAGGLTLADRAIAMDTDNDWAAVNFTDPVFEGVDGFTTRFAAIVKWVTNAADSPVIGTIDFGVDRIAQGGDITVQLNAAGLIFQL